MTITDEFIDHDLTPPLEIGDDDGFTGLLEPDPEAMASVPTVDMEGTFDLIPRSKWADWAKLREMELRAGIGTVLNQGREGSCVANAVVGSAMAVSKLQFGPDWVRLSAMSLYERIGRTAQSGAVIVDGVNQMMEHGALPLDTSDNRGEFDEVYPATGFNPRRLKNTTWKPTAKLFRVSRVVRVNTPEGWFSALMRGWPIVYGRRSHCIFGLLPKWYKGKWLFGYVNSWGDWGDPINNVVGNGMGWDTQRTIDGCRGYAICDIVRRPRITL